MNNEPVAWMRYSDKAACSLEEKRLLLKEENTDWGYTVPLYTAEQFHPAKTLTDEEIWKELTTVKHTWIATTSVWFEFEKEELTKAIRAILRKAQEK